MSSIVGPFGCSWSSSRGNGCRTRAHKCSFRFNALLRVSHLFEQEENPLWANISIKEAWRNLESDYFSFPCFELWKGKEQGHINRKLSLEPCCKQEQNWKDNWKPSHWTAIEQSCKQGDKSVNCWWNVSIGLPSNKVANCQTLLHANRSQWPSHIRIAAGLSVILCMSANILKIIQIRILFQQTSLSRW